METQEIISLLQKLLYQGFVSSKSSDLLWLNDVCGQFLKLFKILQKSLIFDFSDRSNIIEGFFLCAFQIIACISNLEKVLKSEVQSGMVLTSSRQFFLDRILWCLTKLSNLNTVSSFVWNGEEENFVNCLDLALEMIAALALYKDDVENIAEDNASAMIESRKIRSIIDSMISHTLSFANVVHIKDKQSLTSLCQKVLSDCILFEEECAFTKSKKICTQSRRMKAECLETTLCRLEKLVNDCLLRLVFSVFTEIKSPFQNFDDKTTASDIEAKTDKFDLLNDRLTQIGLFAVVFADDTKTKSIIRSCLASLESLELNLIPSLYSPCKTHANILKDHWINEVNIFQFQIQKIIDSNAFSTSLLEKIVNFKNKSEENLDVSQIEEILSHSKVLLSHFKINYENLNIQNINVLNELIEKFQLMINECKASLKVYDTIETNRIRKRLNVLHNVLEKIQNIISGNIKNDKVFKSVQDTLEDDKSITELNNSTTYFENFGIKPSFRNILYQSKRIKKKKSESLVPVASQFSISDNATFRSRKKRMSLRVAMFKKAACVQTNAIVDEIKQNHSLELHITEILEQLTNLSGTFSINT